MCMGRYTRPVAAMLYMALVGACGSQQGEALGAVAASLAAAPGAPAAPATTYQLPPGVPPLPADLLAVGSQEARDDLYCSALIYNANPDVSDALAPVDEALLRKAQALAFIVGEAGINKLVEAKAIHATHARAIADAYAAQVEADMKTGTPRISLEACNARAAAVPRPE